MKILLIFIALLGITGNAKSIEEELLVNEFYCVGFLEYSEHQVLYSKFPGTVDKLYYRSSQKIPSKANVMDIKPMDPSLKRTAEINNTEGTLILSKLLVKRGDLVEKYQPLAILASSDHIQVRVNILAKNISKVYLNKKVTIHLNPDSNNFKLDGTVRAIHQENDIIPMYQAEIEIKKEACMFDKVCYQSLTVGSVVKVTI